MTGDDHRVQIGGNARISGSQIASGQNVSQTQNLGGAPESPPVQQAIARVAELLDRHSGELPDAHRARRDLDDIRQETAEADPDRDRVTDALNRLGARVAGIAVIAEAVRELTGLLIGD
jgi:Family of unknown function (DUF5955)